MRSKLSQNKLYCIKRPNDVRNLEVFQQSPSWICTKKLSYSKEIGEFADKTYLENQLSLTENVTKLSKSV